MKRLIVLGLVTLTLCNAGSLFAETNLDAGQKLFANKNLAESSSEMSCATCHPDGQGLSKSYYKSDFYFQGRHFHGVQEAVNFCVVQHLKGKPLKGDSEEMLNLLEYLKTF